MSFNKKPDKENEVDIEGKSKKKKTDRWQSSKTKLLKAKLH